jgi:hypothetical protein
MKTLIVMTLSSIFLLSGCMNGFRFRAENLNDETAVPTPENEVTRNPDAGSPKPVDPIVDPDQPPGKTPVTYKFGDCTKDPFEVLPCLSCQITQKPVGVPLSTKGAQLLKIMQAGCRILNNSDPQNYNPPTHDAILKFLSRANVDNYPDSTPTARQKNNLSKWLSGDQAHLGKLFGGLWYQPPFSTDFETYFGLEPKEARYFFCYQSADSTFSENGVSQLHSIGYYSCLQEGGTNCRESKEYVAANVYRKQLVNSIYQSIHDPFNDQELVPTNKCFWESMSGDYNLEMETKLIDWKNKGYEMAVYIETGGPRCEKLSTANIPLNAKVTVAGKLCTNF